MYLVPWFILHYLRKKGPWNAWSLVLSFSIFIIVWFSFMQYVYWPYFRALGSTSQEVLEGGLGIIWGASIVGLYLAVYFYRNRMP